MIIEAALNVLEASISDVMDFDKLPSLIKHIQTKIDKVS